MTKDEMLKGYIDYLYQWITCKCDLELDPVTEFEILRLIMDASNDYLTQYHKEIKCNSQEHDGCSGCRYSYVQEGHYPCNECSQAYIDKWEKANAD